MQRQRAAVESLPETFEFELGSTSTNSSMVDSHAYWNVLDEQNMVDFFLSPNEVDVPYPNAIDSESGGMGSWNFPDPSSSGHSIENGSVLDEAKVDHPWRSSLGPVSHVSRAEDGALPILENIDINLGGNPNTFEQIPSSNLEPDILQSSRISNRVFQNSNPSALFVGSSELGLGVNVYGESNASGSGAGHLPSGNSPDLAHGSSTVGFVAGDDGGTGSFDGRVFTRKRKDLGAPEHCANGASSSYSQQSGNGSMQISNSPQSAIGLNILRQSANNLPAVTGPEAIDQTFSSRASGVGSEFLTSSRSTGNTENHRRNVRMRIDPPGQQDMRISNLQPSSNSTRFPNGWSQSPPLPTSYVPTVPLVGSTSMQTQSHPPVIPGLPWFAHPFPWNSRSAGSSPTPVISGERFIAPREETNQRSLARINNHEPPVIVPVNNVQFGQDSTNWGLSGRNVSLQGSAVSSLQAPATSIDLVASSLLPPRTPSTQYQLNLQLVRQSIASAGPNFSGQGNYDRYRAGHAATLLRMASRRASRIHGEQLSARAAAVSERHNAAPSGDTSLQRVPSAGNRRNRLLLSEQIRNVLGLLRRGEDLRFEDLIIDQAVLFGAADMHDRHRDMRLDVDNMSYEELLALEERIGNVSTGLNEETISKCLKQWKYSPLPAEASSPEVEPCSICQEEYVEDEEMGTLNCGHEFHTACIKEWLKQKNLCPICKAAALVT